ncbi:Uncharacterised protein [Mycobacterium tuberculosis]|nr:Uncharacterised protein [Mycobacterium tuberculosis]
MVPAHHVDAVAFVAQDLAWVVRAAVQRHNGVFESSVGATISSGDTSHGHPLMLLMGNARPPTVGPQGAPWSAVGLLSLCLVLGLTHAARQRRLPVMVAGGVDSAPAQRLGSTGSPASAG